MDEFVVLFTNAGVVSGVNSNLPAQVTDRFIGADSEAVINSLIDKGFAFATNPASGNVSIFNVYDSRGQTLTGLYFYRNQC